jgi:3-oxoadipate enol-lactonase/4-carboxymuconolactone decarboxylase
MIVDAGGLDVHVRIDGPPGAAPLLLLHSLGTSQHVWDAQAEVLAQSFRVIRPDLRGHGLSGLTPGPYSMAGLAQDQLALLDALGVASAHVAGISVGGMIAQAMAHAAPERVRSLLLVDTAMAIPPPETWRERAVLVRAEGVGAVAEAVMGRWVTPGFAAAPQARFLRAQLLRTPAEGYAATAEAIAAADLSAAAAKITLPTLVLVGDQDAATPLSSAEALAAAIAGATLTVIAGAAHLPTAEKPAEVTAAMLGFLTQPSADRYAAGMAVRKQVLGEAHVARASGAITDFDRDFQAFITRAAWGEVWTRPGLDRRTRSLLTIALMAGLGHHEELKLHFRASRNTGATQAEIAEVLMQVAVYAGVPAGNTAIRIAKETFKEMDS